MSMAGRGRPAGKQVPAVGLAAPAGSESIVGASIEGGLGGRFAA